MSENIYNFFLFFDEEICSVIGYTIHAYSGNNDQQSIDYLMNCISTDFVNSTKLRLSRPFTRSEFNARCRLGQGHYLYDEIFSILDANANPLFIATPVLHDKIFYNYSSAHGCFDINEASEKLGAKGVMKDWLVQYTNSNKLDIPQLINDDYFLAIKLTFNEGLYVSSMKLLLSCIDSLAYIEFGNDRKSIPFIKWLESYADLMPLKITANELWELRNGVLHMTNINSTKVRDQKVRRISFKVGGKEKNIQNTSEDSIFYFDFYNLLQIIKEAIKQWILTYNENHNKFVQFVERYDETISDSRAAFCYRS